MTSASFIEWALQTSLAVSILIALVLIVRKPVARILGAQMAYALWLLPLLRLVMPAIPILKAKPALIEPAIVDSAVYAASASPLINPSSQNLPVINWEVTLISIWIAGAVLWAGIQIFRQNRYRFELENHSAPIDGRLLSLSADVTQKIGMNYLPEIRLSRGQNGPLVTGLFYPVIVLPRGFEQDYSREQQELTLAHELSHVRRGDIWAALTALMFRALNWPNPLVHIANQAFRSDQEAACDQTVLKRLGDDPVIKNTYAHTLIHAAKLAGHSVQPSPLGLTIFTPLKERLMILKTSQKKSAPLRITASLLALGTLIATAPFTAVAGPDSSETHAVEKKVMKWITNEDGVESKRHIEITTENGVTTAYEIDELGNKMQIDLDTIDMPDMPHTSGDHKVRVMVKNMGDGDMSELDLSQLIGEHGDFDIDIQELMDGHDGERKVIVLKSGDMDMSEDGERNVIIRKMHGDGHVMAFSNDDEFEFHSSGEGKAKMMVGVASDMLENVNTDDMDRATRKKVEEAQKALKEAQEALEEE